MTIELAANANVVEMEYAVRGPIPKRAAELQRAGRNVIFCNIGNPQALGQRPITFYRGVLGLLDRPESLARERKLRELAPQLGLPQDGVASEYMLDLAERMLRGFAGGLGAYTHSKGPLFVREAIARAIDLRDRDGGAPAVLADPECLFLTNGASEAVKQVMEILIAGPQDGVMIPIPQYPLYSAVIRRCGGRQVDYYLDEESGWTLERAALDEALARAKRDGIRVKAIVAINPGNPTGAVLPERSIRELLDFAAEHELVVIADEVYQENVYGAEFVSFAKVLGRRDVPLCSLHSASKGFYGECGRRGGYLEVRNAPRIRGTNVGLLELLEKQASVSLCSNTSGQALMYLIASPPPKGSEPHELFVRERTETLDELHAKAELVQAALRQMRGVECFGRVGALYLFPRLGKLPVGTTDFDYCMNLLERTGLCTVNGAGFGQAPGTQHLRIAFLPQRSSLADVLPRWIEFHEEYVRGV
ncbi:MAG: aminotransferase class I/II-fold pyridoxal phosphate-dependent enzyme [Planctomycetes bacterium]|nr:aminotransferase class I/II-fold pyridoxal phosphate-dependent enzyme [Planctomycetota bacterium]